MTHQDYILRLFKYFAQFIPKTVLEDSLRQPDSSSEDGYAEAKADLLLPSERIINEFTGYICSSNPDFVADKVRNNKGFFLFVEYGSFSTNPSGAFGVGKRLAITVAHQFTHTNSDNLNESLLMNRCQNLLNHVLLTMEYDQSYNNGCSFIGRVNFPADVSPIDPEAFYGRVGFTAMLSVDETMVYDPLNTPWPDPGGHTPASEIEQRLEEVESIAGGAASLAAGAAEAAQENSNRIGNLTNGTITRDENGNIASITTFDEATTINRDEDGILTGWENDTHIWTITRDVDGNITGWTFTEKP